MQGLKFSFYKRLFYVIFERVKYEQIVSYVITTPFNLSWSDVAEFALPLDDGDFAFSARTGDLFGLFQLHKN